MRLFLTTAVTVGLMLFSAASASAIAISLGAPSGGTTLNVGDTFTITLNLDTQGETQVTTVFASVFADNGSMYEYDETGDSQFAFQVSTSEQSSEQLEKCVACLGQKRLVMLPLQVQYWANQSDDGIKYVHGGGVERWSPASFEGECPEWFARAHQQKGTGSGVLLALAQMLVGG